MDFTPMDEIEARPELIERLAALATKMNASPAELQAAAREWADIEAVLEEAEAEIAAGAPTYDAKEVFAESRAILEEQ